VIREQLFPDNFAKREILSLQVKCPKSKEGCGTIEVLKQLTVSIIRLLIGLLHEYLKILIHITQSHMYRLLHSIFHIIPLISPTVQLTAYTDKC
jgi:hypothetical protein